MRLAQMRIFSLPAKQSKFIDAQVRAGRYASATVASHDVTMFQPTRPLLM